VVVGRGVVLACRASRQDGGYIYVINSVRQRLVTLSDVTFEEVELVTKEYLKEMGVTNFRHKPLPPSTKRRKKLEELAERWWQMAQSTSNKES
jgi:hypothetical protein